jgi:hypothetical protein
MSMESGYTKYITGEHLLKLLGTLSRGALWKLQVGVDQKQ